MRENQFLVTVALYGKSFGVWDHASGGVADSAETKYKPGGMTPEIALGGSRTITNVTVRRLFLPERDGAMAWGMSNVVGIAPMTVSKQPLDANGNPYGAPTVYQGILKAVHWPDADSTSNAAGLIELEMSTAGTIG